VEKESGRHYISLNQLTFVFVLQTANSEMERFSNDLENGFGKCSSVLLLLFYWRMDEKIKTWPLQFSTKENPNMEKALFHWPIVLQYDVIAKYPLVSRKFLGHEVFSP